MISKRRNRTKIMPEKNLDERAKRHRRELNETIDDGGCTGAWKAADNIRNGPPQQDRAENAANRRNILRRILGVFGTSVASVLGFSRTVTATDDSVTSQPVSREDRERLLEELQELSDAYDTPKAVRKALSEHALPLLEELSARNLLESSSPSGLKIDEVVSLDEFGEAGDGVTVVGDVHENGTTANIQIRRKLTDGSLLISVLPHVGEAYAIIERDSDSEILAVDSTENVSTQSSCYTGSVCFLIQVSGPSARCEYRDIYCCTDGTCYYGDWGEPAMPVMIQHHAVITARRVNVD